MSEERNEVNIKPLDELEERYFREHPEEIDEYVLRISNDYAQDKDLKALSSSLRIIYRIRMGKDVDDATLDIGMVRSILKELGYSFTLQ